MKRLTTIAALLKRVRRKPELAACAMAALLFLAAMHAPARAQNTYGGSTFVNGGSIGMVPGQRISITVPAFYFQDGSVKFLKSSVLKVYDRDGHAVTERTSNLTYSGESGGLNELGQIFTLSYSDLPVQGEPRTGRKEVWLEVHSISFSTTQNPAEDPSAVVLPPTFELIDPDGRTVIFGLLLPVSGPTQAQLDSFYAFEGFQGGVSVGAAAGQTVRILIEAADAADSSLNKPSGEPGLITGSSASGVHVKVFNASTGALLWSRELTNLTPGHHTFDVNRDEFREVGNPDTGRIQLWIEVVLVGMKVSLPTFEVFDNESGKTTVRDVLGPMKESMQTMKKAWKDAS